VAIPEGSGLGPSSAKQGAANPANNPATRRMAALADTVADNDADSDDRRRERLPNPFLMFDSSCF
jgi:hypothetical protein